MPSSYSVLHTSPRSSLKGLHALLTAPDMRLCHGSVNTVASYGQLLSAPSYDDATLFDQVEIQPTEQHAGNGHKTQGPPATSVTVDDPVKKVEQTLIPGMNGGFVTYRVTTKTQHESFASPESSVRRRFRDFVVSAPATWPCTVPATSGLLR